MLKEPNNFVDSDSSLTLKVYMTWNSYSLVGKILKNYATIFLQFFISFLIFNLIFNVTFHCKQCGFTMHSNFKEIHIIAQIRICVWNFDSHNMFILSWLISLNASSLCIVTSQCLHCKVHKPTKIFQAWKNQKWKRSCYTVLKDLSS